MMMAYKKKVCTHEIVPFETVFGDVLNVVKHEDGKLYASIRRVCEHLGVTEYNQQVKLKRSAWATTTMINTPVEDGRIRPQLYLDIDGLPLWMATLHVGRIAEHLRPKVRWYQEQARDVLAAAFLPASIRGDNRPEVTVHVEPSNGIALTESMWSGLISKLDSLTGWFRRVETRADATDAKVQEMETKIEALASELERTQGILRETIQAVHNNMPPKAKKPGVFMDLWDRLCG
jgi:hypothetical protein